MPSAATRIGTWVSATATPLERRKKSFRLPLRHLNLAVGTLLVMVGAAYLVQVNSLATKGYYIRELQQQIQERQKLTRALELQAMGLRSLDTVQSRVDELGMVAIGSSEFLNPTPVAVAR